MGLREGWKRLTLDLPDPLYGRMRQAADEDIVSPGNMQFWVRHAIVARLEALRAEGRRVDG